LHCAHGPHGFRRPSRCRAAVRGARYVPSDKLRILRAQRPARMSTKRCIERPPRPRNWVQPAEGSPRLLSSYAGYIGAKRLASGKGPKLAAVTRAPPAARCTT
jgi:hypothetical protein